MITTSHRVRIGALFIAGVLACAPLAAGASSPKPTWLTASIAQGAVNAENSADPASIACSAVGTCAVLGTYSAVAGSEDFLYSEVAGKWTTPVEVAASLNSGNANVGQVSCGAPGYCALGGTYAATGDFPFVQSQFNGHWLPAAETAASLNTKSDGGTQAVSCWGTGDCAAEGYYKDSSGTGVFVVTSTNGKWGQAQAVAANLNTYFDAQPDGVSCSGPGDCTAVGQYSITSLNDLRGLFGVTETNGKWGTATEIASTLTTDGVPNLVGVSCAAPGDCVAIGTSFEDGHIVPFAVAQNGGKWAGPVTLVANLDTDNQAGVTAVSCTAPGDCTVAGSTHAGTLPYVQTETAGKWGLAKGFAIGSEPLIQAGVESVSCWAPGDCAASGSFSTSTGPYNGFLATSSNGQWSGTEEVPGATSTSGEAGSAYRVDCIAGGFCGVTGVYETSVGDYAFGADHQGLLDLAIVKPTGPKAGKKATVTVNGVAPGASVTLTAKLGHKSVVTTKVATGSSLTFSVLFTAGKWTLTATAKGTDCLVVPASSTVTVP